MSINLHINLSVVLEGAAPDSAGFGVPMFVYEHVIAGGRQQGPFSSVAALVTAGHVSGSAAHTWATALLSQNPKVSQFYIGQRLTADDDLTASLDAIEAVDPSTFYCLNMQSRLSDEILEMATWVQARNKIAIVQSNDASILSGEGPSWTTTVGGSPEDGDYTVTFTGFGLESPVVVTTTRSTTPDTNDDLATQIAADIEAESDLDDIVALAAATDSVVDISIENDLPVGTITAAAPGSATHTADLVDADIASFLAAAGYTRTALWYHPTDAEYLDGGMTGVGLAFALEAPGGAGTWAYKRIAGVSSTQLTSAQKTAILAANANFYSPVRASSGTEIDGFTFKGSMASGRQIDVATTLDLTHARMEEAIMGVHLGTPTKNAFTDAGIAKFQAAANGVMANLVAAGHYDGGALSASTGRRTPWIDVPLAANVSSADKQAGMLTMTGEAILAGSILSIGDPETVGFTVNVNFA
jgi:hypothetical protein